MVKTKVRQRKLRADDLYRLRLITDARISPDGANVIMAVQRVCRASEKKYSNLWLAPTAGGAARQFTYGDQCDNEPRWSPDGRLIAFLSNRFEEQQNQVFLIPVDGGEARPLTRMSGTFQPVSWSPDGSRLVCSFRRNDPDPATGDVVARHIKNTLYKLNGSGYLPKEKWHLCVPAGTYPAMFDRYLKSDAGEYRTKA